MSVIPSNVNWGFTPQDLFANGQSLFVSVSGFVLILLAFPMGQLFVGFIKSLFRTRSLHSGDDKDDDDEI